VPLSPRRAAALGQVHAAAGALPVHFVDAALAPVPAGGKLWVLLVAGSSGYMNYRHQADVCHAYQVRRGSALAHAPVRCAGAGPPAHRPLLTAMARARCRR